MPHGPHRLTARSAPKGRCACAVSSACVRQRNPVPFHSVRNGRTLAAGEWDAYAGRDHYPEPVISFPDLWCTDCTPAAFYIARAA